MPVEVLVVGDANPDILLTGDVVPRFGQAEQLLDTADLLLGGSAAIVAAGLAHLDVATGLVGVVGADQFGTFTLDCLRKRAVDLSSMVVDRTLPTGVSVVLSEPRDRAILTLPGTIPTLDVDTVFAAVERLEPAHVHVASYFLQPDLAAALPDLFAWLVARGVSTSLDTNWDPAEQWGGLDNVLPNTTVLMPNREEALAIASSVAGSVITDLDRACAVLSRLGCRVVVKSGADGGACYENGALTAVAPGLILEVTDTTGAGDSFDAGYLAAVVRGVPDEKTRLRWAAVAGSLSVRGRGGTVSQASAAELATTV